MKGVTKCVEFIGLRSKCYALKLQEENGSFIEKKVCKGLGRVAIKNRLKFDEYKKCLFDGDEIRHNFTGILSQKQRLYTVVRNKKALSRFDSKRWIFKCGIHSLPFNSFLIKNMATDVLNVNNDFKFFIFSCNMLQIEICRCYGYIIIIIHVML